jgi:hypothetical protein
MTPEKYLEAHIREALATDARTNLLDPQVTIAAGKVFLLATVESAERRLAVELVVREIIPPELEIINEICIDCFDAPTTGEERI